MHFRAPSEPLEGGGQSTIEGWQVDVGNAGQTTAAITNRETELDQGIKPRRITGVLVRGASVKDRDLEIPGERGRNSDVELLGCGTCQARWGAPTEVVEAAVDAGLEEGEVNQAVWDDVKLGEVHYSTCKALFKD
jgi:hypothetical protein